MRIEAANISSRRKKVCIAALSVSVTATVALVLHVRFLLRGDISESTILLSSAATCLFVSWLLSAVSEERKGTTFPSERANNRGEVIFPSEPKNREMPCHSPRITNAFSIDLEDYFHTEVATQAVKWTDWDKMPSRLDVTVPRLLDLLDEHDTKATIFVLGWIAEKYPRIVREIARRGHELGCHSFRHRAVFRLDRRTFYEDTAHAKRLIEDTTGAHVAGYRAPCFSIISGTEWAFEVLADLGFQYDSSVNPVRHVFYGNAKAPRHPYYVAKNRLLEIPVAVWRVLGMNLPIGGGAYLRLLPYGYSVTGLKRLNKINRMGGTIYIHPWEIDACQPSLGLPWPSHVRQTWGTAGMETKITNLLNTFQFAPMVEVYSHAFCAEATPAPVLSRNAEATAGVSI